MQVAGYGVFFHQGAVAVKCRFKVVVEQDFVDGVVDGARVGEVLGHQGRRGMGGFAFGQNIAQAVDVGALPKQMDAEENSP